MGIPNEPFICPLLARGVRRACQETLDASWADFGQGADPIISADHGISFGRLDPQVSRLMLSTFIDSAKRWEEGVYALKQLTELGEERLALSALDLIANGWIAHDDTHVSERLMHI